MNKVLITFVEKSGDKKPVEACIGDTLMQVATSNHVDGIDGDCGGCCACGTCCMALETNFSSTLPDASEEELELLEFTANEAGIAGPKRLGCQIEVNEAFQNITIYVAT